MIYINISYIFVSINGQIDKMITITPEDKLKELMLLLYDKNSVLNFLDTVINHDMVLEERKELYKKVKELIKYK